MSDFKSSSFGNYTAKIEPWWTLVLVPIWQEFLYRYLPYRFLYLPTGKFWEIGLSLSFVFALTHWYFGRWFMIYAFVGGMALWFVMVKFGLVAAILVHAVMNLFDLKAGFRMLIFSDAREAEKAKKEPRLSLSAYIKKRWG